MASDRVCCGCDHYLYAYHVLAGIVPCHVTSPEVVSVPCSFAGFGNTGKEILTKGRLYALPKSGKLYALIELSPIHAFA